MRDTLRLGEDGREIVIVARFDTLYLAGIDIGFILQEYGIIDGREGLVVKHLSTLHHQVLGTHGKVFITCLQLLHGDHGLAALLHRHEIDHCRSLEGIVLQGLHGHLRKERQRTLRTDNAMGNDVERVVISNEWAEIQSGNVLDAVFFLDTFSKILVSTHTIA